MRFFAIETKENGPKKILYPLKAIAKISEDLNPDFSSDYTKITLDNGQVLKVFESLDEVHGMLENIDLKDEDFILTAYIPSAKD